MGMDQYLYIPFLGEWPSINPSYFDVNRRGTRFWHTATSRLIRLLGLFEDAFRWFLAPPCPPPKKKEPLQRVPTERGVLPQAILDQKTAQVPSGND